MSAARSRRANDKHNHLQRTPILVMGCSLLIACCSERTRERRNLKSSFPTLTSS